MSVFQESLKVIDTDTHFTEPHDLWTSRVPAKYKDSVPHVVRGEKGTGQWIVNGNELLSGTAGASSVIRKDGVKIPFWDMDIQSGMGIDEVSTACYDVKARVEMMDREKIWAQILYPNAIGFAAARLMRLPAELSLLICQVYNDAISELQAESGERIFPMALIPFWDLDAAVKEIERTAKELNLRGLTMSAEPHLAPIPMPDLFDHHWDPLWEVVTDVGYPVNFHIGSSNFDVHRTMNAWPSLDGHKQYIVHASQSELSNARVLANLLTGDLLVRWPDINWVSVESGIGWIPFILERLEWQIMDSTEGGKGFDQPSPTELFHRSIYACFWFEDAAPQNDLDVIGFDNVMFETDFPHPTCYYPSGVEHAEKVLERWGPEAQRKVMQDNAAKLYRIPV